MADHKLGGGGVCPRHYMIKFELLSYPEMPCDFALFGALEWLATELPEGASHAEKYPPELAHLQRAVKLAGLTVPDLLDMVERGHLCMGWERPNS